MDLEKSLSPLFPTGLGAGVLRLQMTRTLPQFSPDANNMPYQRTQKDFVAMFTNPGFITIEAFVRIGAQSIFGAFTTQNAV